jgi:hypothetical protein
VKFLLDTNVYFAAIHEQGYLDRHRAVFLRIGPLTYRSAAGAATEGRGRR